MADGAGNHDTEVSKDWLLDPETEYRFELDPGTTIAIKVLFGNPS